MQAAQISSSALFSAATVCALGATNLACRTGSLSVPLTIITASMAVVGIVAGVAKGTLGCYGVLKSDTQEKDRGWKNLTDAALLFGSGGLVIHYMSLPIFKAIFILLADEMFYKC